MDGISNTVHPWCPPSCHSAARRGGAELWPSVACSPFLVSTASLAVLRLATVTLACARGVAWVIAGGDRRGQPNRDGMASMAGMAAS